MNAMKNIILTVIAFLSLFTTVKAQNINWAAFQEGQHQFVYLQAGWDYSLNAGAGYGYKFNTGIPLLANVEYSFPAGNNIFDDFKVRLGGQAELLQLGGFSLTAKAYCPIRRYENSLASLFNFGSEFSGVAGYYGRHFFAGGEFGFDKAIVTHVKNSDQARLDYPGIQDGWYIPTGGVYFYGLQTGVSFQRMDISARIGELVNQGFRTKPFIPYYASVGLNLRF